MKITVLMEDTCKNPLYEYEHGFSLYIETKKHKLIMDTGAGAKTIANAERAGIDLSLADTVIISHGHYDHAGGLLAFGGRNSQAAVYMQQAASKEYYHKERYIGIDQRILQMKNLNLLNGDRKIDEELSLFAGISGRRYWPVSNLQLSAKEDGRIVQDEFAHEQCLVIQEEKTVLVSGCAHNGILNILDKYHELYGGYPSAVISGFHMMKKTDYTKEEREIIENTARELAGMDCVFYTGHCTGQKAIDIMKPVMADKLVQLHCGDVIRI